MLKYVSKFALDILPSVVATIIGAYIVNHYIATKPGADAPVAAAASTADPKADAKPSGTSTLANIPEPGVKAKGISERAMIERSASKAERPKSLGKSVDKPAETASYSSRDAPSPARSARKGDGQGCSRTPACSAGARTGRRRVSGRGRDACGRAPRRQRSRPGRDRAPAWRQRWFAATAGSRPHPGCSPHSGCAPRRVGARRRPRRVGAAGSAAAAADHGFLAFGRDIGSGNRIVADAARLPRRRRPASSDSAGRHSPGLFLGLAADRSAGRGDGTCAAGTHDGCRRRAVGREIGVPRGTAEKAHRIT